MQKINRWLIDHIFEVSAYLSLTTLLLIVLTFSGMDHSLFVYPNIFNFIALELNFFEFDIFRLEIDREDGYITSFSYLGIAFKILFILATIVYKISDHKQTKILKFCYSIFLIVPAITFIHHIGFFVLLDEVYYNEDFNFTKEILFSLFLFIKIFILTYISYLYLNHWQKNTANLNSEKLTVKNFSKFTLTPASSAQRFVHLIIDSFLILSIFSFVGTSFIYRDLLGDVEEIFGERFGLWILVVFFSSIYYLITEGLVKGSPAKFITQTTIVNLNNEKVSFTNIIGRTLCRRIPFDAFSFLGQPGWHDTLAFSTVVKQEKEPSKYNWIYIIYFVLFLGLLIYRILEENHFF